MSIAYIILLSYLSINLILSIIARTFVDNANEYWKKYKQPPQMNSFKFYSIGVSLILSTSIAYILGYIHGIINFIFSKNYIPEKMNISIYFIFSNILVPISQILLFLPVLIYVIIDEVYYRYLEKGDE